MSVFALTISTVFSVKLRLYSPWQPHSRHCVFARRCQASTMVSKCMSVFFLGRVNGSKAETELAKCHPETLFWWWQQWVRWNVRLVTGYAWIGLKWGYCPQPPSYYVFINVFFSLSVTFTLKQGAIFMTKRYAMKVSPPPPLENWNLGVPALIACRFDSKNVCAPSWQ